MTTFIALFAVILSLIAIARPPRVAKLESKLFRDVADLTGWAYRSANTINTVFQGFRDELDSHDDRIDALNLDIKANEEKTISRLNASIAAMNQNVRIYNINIETDRRKFNEIVARIDALDHYVQELPNFDDAHNAARSQSICDAKNLAVALRQAADHVESVAEFEATEDDLDPETRAEIGLGDAPEFDADPNPDTIADADLDVVDDEFAGDEALIDDEGSTAEVPAIPDPEAPFADAMTIRFDPKYYRRPE